MASLRETQLAFADAVLFDDPSRITELLRGGAFSPIERIGIYRNNTRLGFLATMEAMFPVVRQLGGDDWFAGIARRYQQRHPSRSGNLHCIGERFSDFLAAEQETPDYFADVAALEWAYQEVMVAADAATLDLATLSEVSPDRYSALRLQVHPATRLVAAHYPILQLWQAHRDSDANADLSVIDMNVSQRVLVFRRDTHVELRALPLAEFALLDALTRGASLEEALIDDDALAALPRVAQLGALVGFTLSSDH